MKVFNPAPSFDVARDLFLLVSAARRSGARLEVQVYLKRGPGALGVVLASDTINLATQAARTQAAETLAAQAEVAPAVIDAALIRVLEDADLRLRETEPMRPAAPPPSTSSDAEIADARNRARAFLDHEHPLELLDASLRGMRLGGSLVIPKLIFLAATTRVMSACRGQQCHNHVQGPTAAGKSHEVNAALAHLPEGAVLRFDGASPRALIYHDGDIRARVLLYSEMDALPTGGGDDDASNTALTYLRTLASEGRARYSVVEKGEAGKYVTNHYEREGPAVLIVTGTHRLADEQMRSRVHEVEVDVTRDRIHEVLQAQSDLLKGVPRGEPDPAVVAAQEYLQLLAPIDVLVPFASALAESFFDRVRTADPRLTRELSRVTGFTAAHALLRIEARQRTAAGEVIAELDDYEAAREVVRELSTSREFPALTVKVWDTIFELFAKASRPVAVADVKAVLLRDHNTVRKAFNVLLSGGALEDKREKPTKTAPHLVTPVGVRPGQVLLPSVEEVVRLSNPPAVTPKQGQPITAQEAGFGTEADIEGTEAAGLGASALSLGTEVSSLTGHELTQLRRGFLGVEGERSVEPEESGPAAKGNGHDPAACSWCGSDSCSGDCAVEPLGPAALKRMKLPATLAGLGQAAVTQLPGPCSRCAKPDVYAVYGSTRLCVPCARLTASEQAPAVEGPGGRA
jgi:hypothetical protein